MKIVGLNRKRLKEGLEEMERQRNKSEIVNAVIELYCSNFNTRYREDMPPAPFEDEIIKVLEPYEWYKEENMNTIRLIMGFGITCLFGDIGVLSMANDVFGSEPGSDLTPILSPGLIPAIRELIITVMEHLAYYGPEIYTENEFAKLLKQETVCGFTVDAINVERGRLLFRDDICSGGIDFCYQLCSMTDEVDIPTIFKKDNGRLCIMCMLLPDEIKLSEDAAKDAAGDVLCIGTKTGYLEYLLSQKEEVTSVTVIVTEKFAEIFNEIIIPRFPNKDKVKTIEGNWEEIIKQGYDRVYVNKRLNDQREVADYIRMRRYEKTNGVVFYYIHKNMIMENIKSLLFILIYDQLFDEDSVDMRGDEVYDAVAILAPYLEDYQIKSTDDILRIMSSQVIDEIF